MVKRGCLSDVEGNKFDLDEVLDRFADKCSAKQNESFGKMLEERIAPLIDSKVAAAV